VCGKKLILEVKFISNVDKDQMVRVSDPSTLDERIKDLLKGGQVEYIDVYWLDHTVKREVVYNKYMAGDETIADGKENIIKPNNSSGELYHDSAVPQNSELLVPTTA
jgi:hypothetical protein